MVKLKKAFSAVLCLVVVMALLGSIGMFSVSAATQSFSNSVDLEKILTTSNMSRGSHIFDSVTFSKNVLKVPVSNETHLELKAGQNSGYKAYLTAIPASGKPQQSASGYTRAIWIKYKVKSIGKGGYAQVGIGYTTSYSNSFTNTTVLAVDNRIYEADDTEYGFAASIPYNGNQEYRFVFSGYKDVEYEITSVKWASVRKTNYGVVSYHIGNNFMYPVFCTNQAQQKSGFASLGASVDTVAAWYDENDNAVSGNLITSSTGYADINLYDQPKESVGKRLIASSGVNWYSDTVTNGFSSGSGTQGSPYIIKTAAELRYAIASGGNGKYYKLGNDITVNSADSASWYNSRGLKNWKKSSDSDNSFSGTFDGAGYKISGVLIDYTSKSGEAYLGLFPSVNNATIKNLKLENICIKAEISDSQNVQEFGGLVGKVAGNVTVENVMLKSVTFDVRGLGTPTAKLNIGIGGVIGSAVANVSLKDLTVKKLNIKNNFTNANYKSFVGGIIGYISSDKSLNISNALVFDIEPLALNLPKASGKVSNVWAIGDKIGLNANYSGLKTSAESTFYGVHQDFVNNLGGSSNWLPDKVCFMPTLKSFASEQTEQHSEHLEANCILGERCKYCGKIFDTTLDPDNHENVITENGIPYTCDMIGYSGELYCNDCKKHLGEGQSVDALGHNYGAWKTVKAATTKTVGLKERVCKRCGYVDTDEIPVLTEKTKDTSADNVKNNTKKKTNGNKINGNSNAEDTSSVSAMTNGKASSVTVYNNPDNTLRVILLIAIPSAILLIGIVLSVLILLKKKR